MLLIEIRSDLGGVKHKALFYEELVVKNVLDLP